MHSLLETAAEEHMVRLRGITQRAADQAASDARFKELQHVEEVTLLQTELLEVNQSQDVRPIRKYTGHAERVG